MPEIYEKIKGEPGMADLKVTMIKKNLFVEAKSAEIKRVSIEGLGIELPKGYE